MQPPQMTQHLLLATLVLLLVNHRALAHQRLRWNWLDSSRRRPISRCEFSTWEPLQPAWDSDHSDRFSWMLHNISHQTADRPVLRPMLSHGTLLGAYRNHGVIPGDKDVDLMFDICDNLHTLSNTSYASWTCADFRTELKPPPWVQGVWEAALRPILASVNVVGELFKWGVQLSSGDCDAPEGTSHGPAYYGCLTVDVNFQALGHTRDDLCTCSFGWYDDAICPVNALAEILDYIGDDWDVPMSQCLYYHKLGHPGWAPQEANCKHENAIWNTFTRYPDSLCRGYNLERRVNVNSELECAEFCKHNHACAVYVWCGGTNCTDNPYWRRNSCELKSADACGGLRNCAGNITAMKGRFSGIKDGSGRTVSLNGLDAVFRSGAVYASGAFNASGAVIA